MTSSVAPDVAPEPVVGWVSMADIMLLAGTALTSGGRNHLGGAESAAVGGEGDGAEALGALPGGRLHVRLGLAAGHEMVDGLDHEEEQHGSDDDEVDHGLD